ncbi:hypothetical protein [Amycolatopsis kentuckyensis]|uniref:hypothetical protein n=1 Tax=Amycolatopsis kentuckyensis TaxID=218823 RepID=UPI000A3C905A|nr:hypothetical protein [Amycolatopsis kentuckyensis]
MGKGNRPPATSGSGQLGDGAPARVEPAVPETEQVPGGATADSGEPPDNEVAAASAPSTEDRVRDAVTKLAGEEGGWVSLVDIRKALGDVDADELNRALREMSSTNPNVQLVPEDNRKALQPEDHAAAVEIGGDDQHFISIARPRDTAAKDRVQAAGIGNASDDDLAQALRDPLIPSQTYDEIRAEQKRRTQRMPSDKAAEV